MNTLDNLFGNIPVEVRGEIPAIEIRGITADSRKVEPGYVFVAVPGKTSDGHDFIPDAIHRGAAAIVGVWARSHLSVPYLQVENARRALAHLAAAFCGFPARRLIMIGVTGTDGKTTTVNLIYQILLAAGIKAGMISTVNAVIGDQVLDTGFHTTTPDAPEVQKYLSMMVEAGITHCVLETTSHGWAQHRVDGCEFNIGVLTNITHEHLDEHGSFENYRAAKARLFYEVATAKAKEISQLRVAILNGDDPSLPYFTDLLAHHEPTKVLVYSVKGSGDVLAQQIEMTGERTRFWVRMPEDQWIVESRLPGLYNVSNCLAAIAATVGGLGIEKSHAQRAIAAFPGIQGRMEHINLGQSFTAIVDFAHTPNALKEALNTVREQVEGRIIAVFGSAGLRDKEKRRMMAQLAADLADINILTAEDPRTESLAGILEEMKFAALEKGAMLHQNLFVEPDRREAIRLAVSLAEQGDVVIVCGKGHEQSMCFGTTEYPWDDRTALKAAIAERLHLAGPEMPWLPSEHN